MPLEFLSRMYERANRENYAIGQFNVSNLEFVQAAIGAAVDLKAPIILASSSGAIKYAGIETLVAMVRSLADKAPVPIALHLDHGEDLAQAQLCIKHGYTSVMIDASGKPLEENIRITREVATFAHAAGVTVEAELGRLGGIEDNVNVSAREAFLTDPLEAQRFVRESACDALAIAVGTSHGAYKFKGKPVLDFTRISTIKKMLGIPLVLHGASSVDPQSVAMINQFGGHIEDAHGMDEPAYREAISRGINKVNIDTDLRLKWTAILRKQLAEKPAEFDPRKLLGPARDAVREVIKEKITLLGSAGKA
ncbi:MAG: class II fructose-1,6-bisphosphate aldolase [Planctomycetes bacterium]|nr:class II fructose-1,6-bisphosphate aldolase [Planctomycetota bacterium]